MFELYPNYVAHLLATAGVVFGGKYAEIYRHTVAPGDLDWIREHEHLLAWGDGRSSPLTLSVVFIPGYLNPESSESIYDYFDTLRRCVQLQNMQPLLDRYPKLANLRDWVQGPLIDPGKLEQLSTNSKAIEHLGSLMLRNLRRYTEDVLPQVRPRIALAAHATNTALSEHDFVGAWERMTGRQFKYPTYTFVLSDAMGEGPSFNSLGYEKNWVYFDHPNLLAGIVHEIGTHILIDLAMESFRKKDFERAYRVYETICHHYASEIAAEAGLHDDTFTRWVVYDPAVAARLDTLRQQDPTIEAAGAFAVCLDE